MSLRPADAPLLITNLWQNGSDVENSDWFSSLSEAVDDITDRLSGEPGWLVDYVGTLVQQFNKPTRLVDLEDQARLRARETEGVMSEATSSYLNRKPRSLAEVKETTMSADKRSVSTDALETLGTTISEGEGRDAIHLAVEPAKIIVVKP